MNTSVYRYGPLLSLLDALGLFGFYNLAHRWLLGEWIAPTSAALWALIMVALLSLYVMNVYRIESPLTRSQLPLETFTAVLVASVCSLLFVYTIGMSEFVPLFGHGVLLVAMGLFALWAPCCRWLLTRWRQDAVLLKNWLVVAEGELFDQFSRELAEQFPQMRCTRLAPDAELAELQRWRDANSQLSGVIFPSEQNVAAALSRELMALRLAGMPILTLSEFYERYWLKLRLLTLHDAWFIYSRGFSLPHDRVGLRVKRVLDFVVGVVGMVVAAPLLMVVAGVIRLTSPGAVLYVQPRIGMHGHAFNLYKFRTMFEDAEADGAQWARAEDPRATRVGRILRASRIDELPQLWNLIRGEMSLIGPRPERPEFIQTLQQQIPYYQVRHLVPPGITGWAQVMYPYGSTLQDARNKLEYDLYYIKNHSIQLDLAIVIKTVMVILKARGR